MKLSNILNIVQFKLSPTRAVIASAIIGLVGSWWHKSTSGFTDFNRSKPNVAAEVNVEALPALTAEAKDEFVGVVSGYVHRDRIFKNSIKLSPEEVIAAAGKFSEYELLEEVRCSSGYYGAAFKRNNQIILVNGGMDFSTSLTELAKDLDDVFYLTSGGGISQLEDAFKFADSIQEKYGQIDVLSGHSLGAVISSTMIGSGKYPEAKAYLYDSAGVTRAQISHCCSISGMKWTEVEQVFKNKCMSITVSHNSLNDIGTQAGIGLTVDNKPNGFFILYPNSHIYSDAPEDFLAKLNEAEDLIVRTNDGQSGGPTLITLLLLTGAGASLLKPRLCNKSTPEIT